MAYPSTTLSSDPLTQCNGTLRAHAYASICEHEDDDILKGVSYMKSVGCLFFMLILLCVLTFLAGLGLFYWNHGPGGQHNTTNKTQTPPVLEAPDEKLQVSSRD